MTSFHAFGLAEPIARALADEKYDTPTPIQAQTIPLALAGRDVIGIAQTGTGKTAAFALPILHRLFTHRQPLERKHCRVVVLSPTRELSGQIRDSFKAYGRHLHVATDLAIGGVPMGRQVRALMSGLDVLVATPGRLLDLVRGNALKLDKVEVLVLDEADRMLDMGFIQDIRRIVAKMPAARQTLFFSATMPAAIADLAAHMLRNPERVAVTPVASTAERIDQRIVHVDRANKPAVLADLLRREPIDRSLVFTRTKHGADKVVRSLAKAGIVAHAIHGNKSQNQRERVLAAFRTGDVRVLIATDIAARGIDVDGISHVFNFDLPNVPETYVHRIGRTARAGAEGVAISLCDGEERAYLRDIEKLIRRTLPATDARRSGPYEPAAAREDTSPRPARQDRRHETQDGRRGERSERPRQDRGGQQHSSRDAGARNGRDAKPHQPRAAKSQQQPQRGPKPAQPRHPASPARDGAPGRDGARDRSGPARRGPPRGGHKPAPIKAGAPLPNRPTDHRDLAVETELDGIAFLRRSVPARRPLEQRAER